MSFCEILLHYVGIHSRAAAVHFGVGVRCEAADRRHFLNELEWARCRNTFRRGRTQFQE